MAPAPGVVRDGGGYGAQTHTPPSGAAEDWPYFAVVTVRCNWPVLRVALRLNPYARPCPSTLTRPPPVIATIVGLSRDSAAAELNSADRPETLSFSSFSSPPSPPYTSYSRFSRPPPPATLDRTLGGAHEYVPSKTITRPISRDSVTRRTDENGRYKKGRSPISGRCRRRRPTDFRSEVGPATTTVTGIGRNNWKATIKRKEKKKQKQKPIEILTAVTNCTTPRIANNENAETTDKIIVAYKFEPDSIKLKTGRVDRRRSSSRFLSALVHYGFVPSRQTRSSPCTAMRSERFLYVQFWHPNVYQCYVHLL